MTHIPRVIIVFVFLFNILSSSAQQEKPIKDSFETYIKHLPDITVVSKNSKSDLQLLPEIVGTSIYAGKKSSLVIVNNIQGNVVMNNMRQVLAKVPGIHIWESDPSGIQIGIAARGLSPNRSWEFNIRQNGYDIAADPFGYPEAYYNPQLQGVQRIEIIRGQGSLQYGPQFGGMVNYILKNGSEINKKFQLESYQTIGSNGLFNSFNAISGKLKKINFYSFVDHRNGNGWRENSNYRSNAGFTTMTFKPTANLSITAETMLSHIRSQQPGGLTDNQFNENPTQSLRNRNWFDIVWTTPAFIINYSFNKNTTWNTKIFATMGDRNSVGNINSINIRDSINSITNTYSNRILTADKYRNYGIESRFITNYILFKTNTTLSSGIRFYRGNTSRNANGKGTTGSNYDMTAIDKYPQDLKFQSNNIAFFIEQIFRINDKLSIIPGVRYEWLEGRANGRNGFDINGADIFVQNIKRSRSFILYGIGAEYHLGENTEFYSNLSQAYRPIQFANLQAQPTTDLIDPNLTDANGFNFDFGYRGKIGSYIQFDVGIFYLDYRNRIGIINNTLTSNRIITNVGNSISKGIESMIEFNPIKALKLKSNFDALLYTSYSFTKAYYTNDYNDANIKGKALENAPENIVRTGVNLSYKKIQLACQHSYVDKTFSDANNTIMASANGQIGLIPSYHLFDCNFQFQFYKYFQFKSGINNLFNKNYFTRRSGGYPGPGILPGNGRTYFITVACKI